MSSWADKLRKNLPQQQTTTTTNTITSNNENNNITNNITSTKHRTKKNVSSSTISSSSPILLLTVFHFLSARDLALKCAQVCHAWRHVVHDPGCWKYSWIDHVLSVETGFGRECYDPLPQLLRLAGVVDSSSLSTTSKDSRGGDTTTNNNSIPTPLRPLVRPGAADGMFPSSITTNAIPYVPYDPPRGDDAQASSGIHHANNNNHTHHQIDWQQLEARGGPSLLSDREIDFILKISSQKHDDDDRYKAIVRAGVFRLRYILSILIHSHELRRDLTYEDNFGHLTIAKNYLRKRFIRNLLQKKKDNNQRTASTNNSQPSSTNPTPPVSPPLQPTDATTGSTLTSDTVPTATAAPIPSDHDDDDENIEQQQPDPEPETVFRKIKTRRVKCLTFVDKQQWDDWLGATQQELQAQYFRDKDEEENIVEDEDENINDANNNYNEQENDEEETTFASASEMLPPSQTSLLPNKKKASTTKSSTVGSITALETLQTLRATPSPSVTRLNATAALNIFSHIHVGSSLPSSCQVSLVDSTACVNAEDEELLTDIGALMLGEQPYQPVPVTQRDREMFEYELAMRAKRKRKLRLIEINLKLADDIIRVAGTKPKERDSASELLADFALRPLSRYFGPKTLDQVDSTMRILNVGRSGGMMSSSSTSSTTRTATTTNNYYENNNVKQSFLNSSSFDCDDDGDDTSHRHQPSSSLISAELQLSECLSLLCAPKFFSGPELCQEHSVTILVVDPLRLTLVKLRA